MVRAQGAGELGVGVVKVVTEPETTVVCTPSKGPVCDLTPDPAEAVVHKFEDSMPRKCLEQTTPSFIRLLTYSVNQ